MNLTNLISTIINTEASLVGNAVQDNLVSSKLFFEISDQGGDTPEPIPEGDWLLASSSKILASTNDDYFTWKETKQIIEDSLSSQNY